MLDFDVIAAQSLDHALDVLASDEDVMVVAGATDFIPGLRAGVFRPDKVLDISGLKELQGIETVDGGLRMGALTTHAELAASPVVKDRAAPLGTAARHIAGPQVRNRATVGGNLCNTSPAADTAPALLVLDAEVQLISAEGERQVSLPEFITGPGSTCLRSDELLYGIFVPTPPDGAGAAFKKLGRRRALACSVVNAAALVVGSGSDVMEARLALGAVAPTPVRCRAAETALTGVTWNASQTAVAWERVLDTIDPIDDVRASGAYRRAAAVALAKQVTEEAWRARKQ